MKRKIAPKVVSARAKKQRAMLARAYTGSFKEDRKMAREWDATLDPIVHS